MFVIQDVINRVNLIGLKPNSKIDEIKQIKKAIDQLEKEEHYKNLNQDRAF